MWLDLIPMSKKQCNDFIIDYSTFEKKQKSGKQNKENQELKQLNTDSTYKGYFLTDNKNSSYVPSEILLNQYGT